MGWSVSYSTKFISNKKYSRFFFYIPLYQILGAKCHHLGAVWSPVKGNFMNSLFVNRGNKWWNKHLPFSCLSTRCRKTIQCSLIQYHFWYAAQKMDGRPLHTCAFTVLFFFFLTLKSEILFTISVIFVAVFSAFVPSRLELHQLHFMLGCSLQHLLFVVEHHKVINDGVYGQGDGYDPT